MKSILKYFLVIALLTLSCSKDSVAPEPKPALIDQLKKIPGMQITELTPEAGFKQSYELILKQPLDHQNPAGQQFNQRMYLHHVDEEAPLVLMPSGYVSRPNYIAHLTSVLNANQLYITHRYMGDARPNPANWQYLTIKQAAADHHRIAEFFKEIYSGKWISFGRSKNGMTALFHNRFYPDDVDATVASVTPIIREIDDPRFDVFLEHVGTEECRNRIKTYQRLLLENRDQIIPMITNYMNNSSWTYNIDPGIILEYEVCEYPFAFWQYGPWDCETIPDAGASNAELYQHLENGGGFPIYSDEYRDFYMPVYYQAYTELGWYRLLNDHFAELLETDPNPSYSFFTPNNTDVIFKPEVMQDIENWLQTEGNNIIYIYGADDPWTAAAIELTGQTNALKIVQENTNHNITIDKLDDPGLVYSKLAEWLNIEITGPKSIISRIDQNYQRIVN
jgi:hypothetical protein